jgi:hypothetical protein
MMLKPRESSCGAPFKKFSQTRQRDTIGTPNCLGSICCVRRSCWLSRNLLVRPLLSIRESRGEALLVADRCLVCDIVMLCSCAAMTAAVKLDFLQTKPFSVSAAAAAEGEGDASLEEQLNPTSFSLPMSLSVRPVRCAVDAESRLFSNAK